MKNILRLAPLVASLGFGCGDTDGCFVRGTRVLTPAGWRAIESLEVGDEILSYDTVAKAVVVRKVAQLMMRRASQLATLQAGELTIVGVTLTHPVWDEAAQRWATVGELSLGATLVGLLPGATPQTLTLRKLTSTPIRSQVEVFNLEVDGEEHNYFAEGILVHNKSPAGGYGPYGGSGGTGGTCFVRGTRVLTPSGLRSIEALAIGDEVTSYDTRTKTLTTRRVAEVLRSEVPEVARLRAGELQIAGVSLSHPIWDEAAQRWTPVAELTLGSTVLGLVHRGVPRPLALAELERLPAARSSVEVFNLEVDGEEHNYFAEGILVHNKSGGDGAGNGPPIGGFGGGGGDGGSGGTGEVGGGGGSGGAGGGADGN